MKLQKGQKYDTDKLRFCGWSNGGVEGYTDNASCWDYFDDGVYLGPDQFGVEPEFEISVTFSMPDGDD